MNSRRLVLQGGLLFLICTALCAEEGVKVEGISEFFLRAHRACEGFPLQGYDFKVQKSEYPPPEGDYKQVLENRVLICAENVWKDAGGTSTLGEDQLDSLKRRWQAKLRGSDFAPLAQSERNFVFTFDFANNYIDFSLRSFAVLLPQDGQKLAEADLTRRIAFRQTERIHASSGWSMSNGSRHTVLQANRMPRSANDVELYENSGFLRLSRMIPREILHSLESEMPRWRFSREGSDLIAVLDESRLENSLPYIRGTFDHALWGKLTARFDFERGALLEWAQHDPLGDVIERIEYEGHGTEGPTFLPVKIIHRTWYHGAPQQLRSQSEFRGSVRQVAGPVSNSVLLPKGCNVTDSRGNAKRQYIQEEDEQDSESPSGLSSVDGPIAAQPESRKEERSMMKWYWALPVLALLCATVVLLRLRRG